MALVRFCSGLRSIDSEPLSFFQKIDTRFSVTLKSLGVSSWDCTFSSLLAIRYLILLFKRSWLSYLLFAFEFKQLKKNQDIRLCVRVEQNATVATLAYRTCSSTHSTRNHMYSCTFDSVAPLFLPCCGRVAF